MTADEIVALLDLTPHPEGGWYRQTYEGVAGADGRATSTAIYYLLKRGERSAWHRVDAAEIWHHYAGAALELSLSAAGTGVERHSLGGDLAGGERPQCTVRPGWWQSAATLGDWTLVGCTVAPGFEFSRFELAPTGWEPQPYVSTSS